MTLSLRQRQILTIFLCSLVIYRLGPIYLKERRGKTLGLRTDVYEGLTIKYANTVRTSTELTLKPTTDKPRFQDLLTITNSQTQPAPVKLLLLPSKVISTDLLNSYTLELSSLESVFPFNLKDVLTQLLLAQPLVLPTIPANNTSQTYQLSICPTTIDNLPSQISLNLYFFTTQPPTSNIIHTIN